MPDISEHEFQTPQPTSRFGGSRRAPVIVVVGLVVVAAAVYYFWPARQAQDTTPASAPATAAVEPEATAPAVVDMPVDLPPLAESDGFMRERIAPLSGHPLVATWLETNGLARNVAVVIDNTARGLTPARHLRTLPRPAPFQVVTRADDQLYMDARNHDRFSAMADAVASVDPARAAGVYRVVRPLLQSAYDELGNREPIDVAIARAVSGLLKAPVVEGEIQVKRARSGVVYEFADPALERLTHAQKQLLRMGPERTRAIQAWLRQFAEAAGLSL